MDIESIPLNDSANVTFQDLDERFKFGAHVPFFSREHMERLKYIGTPLWWVPRAYRPDNFPMTVEIPNKVLAYALGTFAVGRSYPTTNIENSNLDPKVVSGKNIHQALRHYFAEPA